MENSINSMLDQLYEIEGLLLVMQRRHDNPSPHLIVELKAKLNLLMHKVTDIENELNSSNIVAPQKPEPKPEPPAPVAEPKQELEPEPTVEPPAFVTKPEPVQEPESKPGSKREIMSTFSINDRFLFLRELFDGNEQRFNEAITHMESMHNINQVSDYITQDLLFDPSREEVKEFIRLVSLNF